MKKILVLAAFVLGSAATQQAVACDWHHQADATPAVVADCTAGNCTTQQTADAPAKSEPASPQVADQPADAAPVIVADCHGNNC